MPDTATVPWLVTVRISVNGEETAAVLGPLRATARSGAPSARADMGATVADSAIASTIVSPRSPAIRVTAEG